MTHCESFWLNNAFRVSGNARLTRTIQKISSNLIGNTNIVQSSPYAQSYCNTFPLEHKPVVHKTTFVLFDTNLLGKYFPNFKLQYLKNGKLLKLDEFSFKNFLHCLMQKRIYHITAMQLPNCDITAKTQQLFFV